jgi:hypothetical protein
MAKTKKTPSRVNGRSLLKWDDKSWARNAIDVARGCGPEGVVILGAIYCIAHYGRTDVNFLLFSLVAIWSLLTYRFLCRRLLAAKAMARSTRRRRR